jgi:hypothetical protein
MSNLLSPSRMVRSGGALFFALSLIALLPRTASADLLDAFANGGFEGYGGNTNSFNSQVPTGWTVTGGTPDTFDGNTNIYGMTWQSSSTGGDFLHGIGWLDANYVESALQIGLDGLVIGQQYEISFEQSISNNISGTPDGGYWEIVFGTESHNSALMALPASGVASPWVWQTMIFTATSQIQTLEVIARSYGGRADMGIDSFFLGDPGTNPDNPDTPSVPEAGSFALLSLSLLSLAGHRRLKLY